MLSNAYWQEGRVPASLVTPRPPRAPGLAAAAGEKSSKVGGLVIQSGRPPGGWRSPLPFVSRREPPAARLLPAQGGATIISALVTSRP